MYRITGFLSLDFTDTIPHRFDRCLGIQLGDIVSPRCLLTGSDISACLSLRNAIGILITHGWFTLEPLKGPVALFDCIFADVRKPWFIETFWYCRSLRNSFFCNAFKMEVNKDMGSSAFEMADWCRRRLRRCWNSSQFAFVSFHLCTLSRGGPSFSSKMGKWSIPQGSGPTFQEKSRKEMDYKGLDRWKWGCHSKMEICTTFLIKYN